MDNEILQALHARKSVRVFTGEPVSMGERAAILDAAFAAPTAGNQQLYTILDITDPALRHTLAELCDHQPFIEKAALCLVFLADCRRWPRAYRAAGVPAPRKPARFAKEALVCENTYCDRTEAELRADFAARAAQNGEQNFDFDAWVQAFCARKYESGFSREMSRSAAAYLADFA